MALNTDTELNYFFSLKNKALFSYFDYPAIIKLFLLFCFTLFHNDKHISPHLFPTLAPQKSTVEVSWQAASERDDARPNCVETLWCHWNTSARSMLKNIRASHHTEPPAITASNLCVYTNNSSTLHVSHSWYHSDRHTHSPVQLLIYILYKNFHLEFNFFYFISLFRCVCVCVFLKT